MENDFTHVMRNRSDSELIQIVTTDSHRYQESALEAARKEIESRNIEVEKFNHVKQDLEASMAESLRIEAATVGSGLRLANYFIDTVAILILAFVLIFFVNTILWIGSQTVRMLLSNLLLLATVVLYYIILESRFQKTLGKLITGSKVITIEGNRPGFNDIFIRTLCRFIPFDNVSFLFTKNGFHDKFSKTTVIRD
ncbi:RDD family protein [Flavobacterium silvaticum]|uniref:RDD family protein n=1 Tax=Flavobacterium silvaticum TaxID=1852020 RepID=A0A972FZV6_9FLAO|nr:RDD family protein [Flavobacterium silvaticum]NMH27831.1 RDD family protein [Flavobacterium silvaticum]